MGFFLEFLPQNLLLFIKFKSPKVKVALPTWLGLDLLINQVNDNVIVKAELLALQKIVKTFVIY